MSDRTFRDARTRASRSGRRSGLRLHAERLEPRSLLNGAWAGYGGNAQHTALSTVASQPLEAIRWSAPIDLNPVLSGEVLYAHYGTPAITTAGTLLMPVKTTATGDFVIQGRNERNGTLLWSIPTNYVVPASAWFPSFGMGLNAAEGLAVPAIGGKVAMIDAPDSPNATISRTLIFYGQANYDQNPSAYDSKVFITTPITGDSAGNIYFGYKVNGSTPMGLQSGIARIAADGTSTYVAATTAASDANINQVAMNSAPALSNDGKTLYVSVSNGSFGYLVALNSTTLATQNKVLLKDPKSGANATVIDISTASPLVGPDGDVYYGVLGNTNGSRGWLTHFNKDLSVQKTSGAFGWDDTQSIVPASMVPSYTGTSSYLLMSKYNNYAGSGDGVNRIAILDPNHTSIDPISGFAAMTPVLSLAGPTPDDEQTANYPFAVKEWCINTAVVDPATKSVLVNSEDGKIYRWDLTTNTFSQVVDLTEGRAEAYTPTFIGPDGAVFAINDAILFAIGAAAPTGAADAYSTSEDGALTVAAPGVLGNDHGGAGMPLTVAVTAAPSHGTLALNPNGSFLYTPTPLYHGPDNFSYTVSDGGLVSAPVTVALTVLPVNHAPTAAIESYAIAEDGTLTVPVATGVLLNDSDIDAGTTLSAQLVASPAHGLLSLRADGSFVYVPTPLYIGSDSFSYRAFDGSAVSATTTVTLSVTAIPHAPTAVADAYTIAENGMLSPVAPGVLANDSDVDPNTTLTVSVVANPTHGTLTLRANGSFDYVPFANYNGTDTFTYKASDGALSSADTKVTITVTPVNTAPVAVADAYEGRENQPLAIFAPSGVLANDSDGDPGTTLTASLVTGPLHGALSLNADGSFLYTPASFFFGNDTFTYRVTDGQFEVQANATIHIGQVNQPPVVAATQVSIVQGRAPGSGYTVATFTDVDNQPSAQYQATIDWGDGSPVQAGTVVAAGAGAYSVVAGHIYDIVGAYPVRVTVTDLAGGASSAYTIARVASLGITTSGAIVISGNHAADGALITNVKTPTIAGTAPAGFVVQVFAKARSTGANSLVGQAVATATNTFSILASAIPDGSYDLSITAVTQVPGSSLSFSATAGAILVDTVAPVQTSATVTTDKGKATLVFTDKGAGLASASGLSNASFQVVQKQRKKNVNVPVTAVDASGFATNGTLTLTLKGGRKLPKGTYVVTVSPGAIKDLAGNAFGGASIAKVRMIRGVSHVRSFLFGTGGRA